MTFSFATTFSFVSVQDQTTVAGRRAASLAAALMVAWSATEACAQHEGDIIVARGAAGMLKVADQDIFDEHIHAAPVNGPLLFGWTGSEPGFDSLEEDDAPNDLFTIESGASVRLECISIDPALKVWAPGFGSLIDGPGDQIVLGGEGLHAHVTWHIDSNDPGFSPSQEDWTATFRLVDAGTTAYTPSAQFVLSVTNVPENVPAASTWGLAALAMSLLIAATLTLGRSVLPEGGAAA